MECNPDGLVAKYLALCTRCFKFNPCGGLKVSVMTQYHEVQLGFKISSESWS